MKDVYEVLQQKEQDIARVRHVLGSGTAAMFSAAAFLSFPGIVERKIGLDCPGTRNCAPVAGRKKECERRFRVRVCPCNMTVVP